MWEIAFLHFTKQTNQPTPKHQQEKTSFRFTIAQTSPFMPVLTRVTIWKRSNPHDQIIMKELVLKHCGSVNFTVFSQQDMAD